MPKIPARKVCLIRLSALGDTVHALALVNGLRRGYPDAEITWILQPVPYEMVQHQTSIDRFIVFDIRRFRDSMRHLNQSLSGEVFDLLLVPQISFKAGLIASRIKAKVKLGFDFRRSRELHWFFTNQHIPHRPPGHVFDQFMEFLEYLEIDPKPWEWNFAFTREEIEYKTTFFSKFDRPVAGCVLASSNPLKDWTVDGYTEVINALQEGLGYQVVVIGGPGRREKEMADAVTAGCRTAPFIGLEKPIRRSMLQLSGCRFVISPDTGPLHAAVAMGIPVIGLYGYSNPRRCGPYLFRDLLIDKFNDASDGFDPINRKVKPGRMRTISAGEVIAKVRMAMKYYGNEDVP